MHSTQFFSHMLSYVMIYLLINEHRVFSCHLLAAGVSCVLLCNRHLAFLYVWKPQPWFA